VHFKKYGELPLLKTQQAQVIVCDIFFLLFPFLFFLPPSISSRKKKKTRAKKKKRKMENNENNNNPNKFNYINRTLQFGKPNLSHNQWTLHNS